MPSIAFYIGEALFVIVAIAYLAEEGRGVDEAGGARPRGAGSAVVERAAVEGAVAEPGGGRPALLVLHLALVLIGLELVVLRADVSPPWLWSLFRGLNVLALVLVPIVVVKSYPERLTAMLSETFGPWLFGVVWAVTSWGVASERPDMLDLALQPLIFLGMHHLLLLAPMLLLLLFDPPDRAASSGLPLGERLRHPAGVFFLLLALGVGLESIWVVHAHATSVLGTEPIAQIVGAVLLAFSVLRTTPRLRQQVVRGV